MKIVVRLWMFFALIVGSSAFALDNPAQFNFDGVLLDNSNNPIGAPTSVKFQIYNPAGNCLLYEETQSVTPDSTTGAFSVQIGVPANRASVGVDGGLAWKTVFANKGVQLRAASTTNCTPGYTPAATDGRALRVTVAGNVLTPDFAISSTPFATTADTLQGYQPSDFLSNLGGSLAGFLKMDSQNEVRFADSGNTNYVALKAPGTVGASYSLALPNADGSNGQMLITNGSGQLSWASPGGGGLPLAGGTMTGAIAMGGNNITATGHITMSAQTTLNLGTYTSVQESTLVGGFSAADKGKTWFNSTTNQMMYYDGSAAQAVSSSSGITALTGDVVASGPGSAAATISANAITSGKIANDAVTTSKIQSAGVAVNRLLMTDNTTGNSVVFADSCANGEVLKWNVSTGWGCATDASGAVTTVAGRTGAVVLDVADIGSGSGKYFTYMPNGTACANGQLMQWNTGSTRWECSTVNWLKHGGNALGAALNVGTTDNFALNLITNSTTKMVVTAAGDVGIGSSTPSSKLDVAGAVSATGDFYTPANVIAGQLQPSPGTAGSPGLNFGGLNTGVFESSGDVGFTSGGTETVRIKSNGNVGIGTNNPMAPLQVGASVGASNMSAVFNGAIQASNANSGVVAPLISFNTYNSPGDGAAVALVSGSNPNPQAAVAGIIETTSPANGKLQLMTLSSNTLSPKMTVTSNGDVGIGITTPGARLDVNGGVKMTGDLGLGNSAVGCSGGNEGALRYNSGSKLVEMCNGTAWLAVPMKSVMLFAGGSENAALTASSSYISRLMGSMTLGGSAYAQATTSNLVTRAGILRNLRVQVGAGAAGAWTFTIIKGTGTTTYTTTPITCTGLTCSDTVNTYSVSPGDEIGIKIDTGATTGSAKVTWAVELESP